MNLNTSIKTCKNNGSRLLEDAEYLYDFDRYPSAFGLTKLAQEEFAKGFILRLVQSGGLKWTKEVRNSLQHHVSKQLMFLILEFLNPDTDEFLKQLKNGTLNKRPPKVVDSMNIYVHEILKRWESKNWFWAEDPIYDKEAIRIFKGKEDEMKQNSFYVKISKDGKATDLTEKINKEMVESEISKTKRCMDFIDHDDDFRYKEIVELFSSIHK